MSSSLDDCKGKDLGAHTMHSYTGSLLQEKKKYVIVKKKERQGCTTKPKSTPLKDKIE